MTVFGTRENLEAMAKENRGLLEKIKEFFEEFIGKIRAAMEHLSK